MFVKRISALIVVAFILLSGRALAADLDSDAPLFPDIEGHWAQDVLERAVGDGLYSGYDDGRLHPDEYISTAQMVTVLCRLLGAESELPAASIGLGGDEWYAPYACRAAALSIISSADGIDAPTARRHAAVIVARAFQYVAAEPDDSVLAAFSDAGGLSGEERGAMSLLVQNGVLRGDGSGLNIDGLITRAEFSAIIYRVVDGAIPADAATGALGGNILTGGGHVSGASFSRGAWFDCTASSVTLTGVTAPLVVLRSRGDGSLTADGESRIDRLVLAGGGSGERSVSASAGAEVGTAVVGATSESVVISGNVTRVEIVGDSCRVTIDAGVEEVVVSGSGNSITINAREIGSLRILSGGSGNAITVRGRVESAELLGEGCVLDVVGSVNSLTLSGKGSEVKGSGRVGSIDQRTALCSVSVGYRRLIDNVDRGVTAAQISVSAPDFLPAGETLAAAATVKSPVAGKACAAIWTIDGNVISEDTVNLTGKEQTLELSYDFSYSRELPERVELAFTLRYVTPDGEVQTFHSTADIQLENYGDDYYKYDSERVLNLVTTGYEGDWTLQWALENDYKDFEKEIWVNAMEYSSTTEYLCWISTAYQRVNIFKGSEGNWALEQAFLCGTGALATPTPVGVYTVWARSAAGWMTATYTVRPVVNFNYGSGYAFHSRLYDPGCSYITDPSIGFPVSHGCIRMYDEDIRWIYDNIPDGTTVVVF